VLYINNKLIDMADFTTSLCQDLLVSENMKYQKLSRKRRI
jgi:hypothetical protein